MTTSRNETFMLFIFVVHLWKKKDFFLNMVGAAYLQVDSIHRNVRYLTFSYIWQSTNLGLADGAIGHVTTVTPESFCFRQSLEVWCTENRTLTSCELVSSAELNSELCSCDHSLPQVCEFTSHKWNTWLSWFQLIVCDFRLLSCRHRLINVTTNHPSHCFWYTDMFVHICLIPLSVLCCY